MTKPRRVKTSQKHSQPRLSADERRDQIIKAARGVFEQSGFEGARTRDLAAAAGVNEALLYRHFASKEELFEAAVATPLEAAVAKLVELSGEPPETFDSTGEVMRERSYQFIYELLGVMDEVGPLLGVMLFGQADRSATYFRNRIDPSLRSIEKVIEANLPAWPHKEFDIEFTVRMTVGTAWFLSTTDKLCDRKRDRAETAKTMLSLLFDGVLPNQALGKGVESADK
jgi:AcrR family transcriptional regulator